MDARYFHVSDCHYHGTDHEWHLSQAKGDYQGYGEGTMKYRACHKCGVHQYIEFRDTKGNVNDIEGMLKQYGLRP